jgi:hypothetical protein
MRKKNAARAIRTGALTLASICLAITTASAQTGILEPPMLSDVVNLNNTPEDGPCSWTRLVADGSTEPFVTTANSVLVITSIQWSTRFTNATADRERRHLRLFRSVTPLVDFDKLLTVVDAGTVDESGNAAGHAAFPSGLVVALAPGEKAPLCYDRSPGGSYWSSDRVMIQGYLVVTARRRS